MYVRVPNGGEFGGVKKNSILLSYYQKLFKLVNCSEEIGGNKNK
jgi:hypothetical protein